MHAFDPNDYRKRVLAAVERRGGIDSSDPFELYDIPLEEAEQLTDAQVGARLDEVWAFWQKQRDHPKYRVLVGLLVDGHEERSYPLLSAASRRVEAEQVRRTRDRRDTERYEMLDSAIERLVQRHGGIPVGKIAGLEDLGKLGGLDPKEIEARLRRHRRIEDAGAPAPAARTSEISAQRRQQIRKLLAEYERLLPGDPVPTLLVLLRLDFTKAHETGEIRLRAEALRSRTRELPPGRIRVVLDELLVHISDVLEAGGAIVDDYLAAIVEDVTEALRPQVRAAVLVEDHLVAGDFEYLVGEAITAGLDRVAAEKVIIGLATELGTTVEGRERGVDSIPGHRGSSSASGFSAGTGAGSGRYAHPGRGTGSASRTPITPASGRTPTGPPVRAWEEPLKAARAALRAGRPYEASQRVDEAKLAVGGDSAGNTAVRPVAEEVDRILAEAALRWRSAASGCGGRRYVDALEHLEYLTRSASDVPNPDGRGPRLEQLLAQARNAMAEADRLFAAAPAAPAAARVRALLSVLDLCADHTGATAALAELPVDAPGRVSATRKPDGTVQIAWSPSVTEQVEYRVTRLQSDGSWRVVGRTRGTALEDGGAGTGPVPVYGVVASISGRASEMSRSDGPAVEPNRSSTGSHASNSARADAAPTPANASSAAATATHPGPSPAARTGGFGAGPHGSPTASTPSDTPSGMPAVRGLTANAGLLTFEWPAGVTEVMVVARADAPPTDPDDPAAARKWKVTNTRYQIDGGAKLPADVPRPCHVAVASCRREATGTLTVAAGFAPAARIHVTG